MFRTRAVAVLLGAVALMGGAAAQTNLEQARQGLAQLQKRIGAFRIQLDWQEPASPDPKDYTPKIVSGTFDGARYRCTITHDPHPDAPPWAGPVSHYSYDGEKAMCHYLIDAPVFCIRPRPDALLPPLYSRSLGRTPLAEWLAKPGIKELEPVQIGDATCLGFELSTDGEHVAVRQVERVWLDPANGWLPHRVEQQVISLEDQTPEVTDSWIYEVTRVARNESGAPFAAETLLRWKVGHESERQRTCVCSVYETGIQVDDDIFAMSPPPGTKVIDEFASTSYATGEAPDMAGLVADEKAPATAIASEDESGTGKKQAVQPARPLRPEPAETTPAWPVQLGVAIALALVAGVGLTIGVRRGRRR